MKYMPRHIREDREEITGNTLCEFLTTYINRKREQSFLKEMAAPFLNYIYKELPVAAPVDEIIIYSFLQCHR